MQIDGVSSTQIAMLAQAGLVVFLLWFSFIHKAKDENNERD